VINFYKVGKSGAKVTYRSLDYGDKRRGGKPGRYYLEDILRQQTLQEHIYRFRCVEARSMVVPWVGFSLGSLLKTVKPLSTANFVKFTLFINRK